MIIERYEFLTDKTFLNYEFESEGPKGTIKKVVRYSLQNVDDVTFFNLGFGNLNPTTGKIDDLKKSDNKDRDKILATVAATVLECTKHFPDLPVYAKGSTPTRTRLYQMGIAANWDEIKSLLDVYGGINGKWQKFTKEVNYDAFLAVRKK